MENVRIEHIANEADGRFVAYVNDEEAGYIKYEWMPNGNFKANGTLVFEAFRSYKLGQPLYEALLNFAREQKVKIYPTCPFVVKMMNRDSGVWNLLDEDYLKEHPELK